VRSGSAQGWRQARQQAQRLRRDVLHQPRAQGKVVRAGRRARALWLRHGMGWYMVWVGEMYWAQTKKFNHVPISSPCDSVARKGVIKAHGKYGSLWRCRGGWGHRWKSTALLAHCRKFAPSRARTQGVWQHAGRWRGSDEEIQPCSDFVTV